MSKKKKRSYYRKRLIEVQYYEQTKKTMRDEMFLLPYISKLTGIKDSDFTFGGDNRAVIEKHFDKLCTLNGVNPKYNNDVNQQKAGADFYHKGLFIDVKCNDEKWENACYELYKNKDSLYTFNKPKDCYIIASFMKKTGELLLCTNGLIEMIVNQDIKELPLSDDFYFTDKLKMYQNKTHADITNACINSQELKKVLQPYASYYCDNTNAKRLLSRGCIIDVDMEKYREYIKSVKEL